MAKEDRGFMSVCSTNVLFAGYIIKWSQLLLITWLSSLVKTASATVELKMLSWCNSQILSRNSYMGRNDQLDSYLNNLRPCIGDKNWFWAQLINMVWLLQVAAYRFYCHLHPEKRVSQLDLFGKYRASICKTRSHSCEKKMYPSPTWCQPILTVISLGNIPKVAASIARKIAA